jgi:hypothetical protein
MRASWLRRNTLLPVLGGLLAVACSGDDPVPPTPIDPADVTRDYHQDAKAVLERYCTSCHQAGGIAPFALTDYESARNHAAVIKGAVTSGNMPPWLPSDNSLPVRYSRKMAEADKQILLDWIADGALEGDKGAAPRVTIPPADVPPLPRHDLTLEMPTPYMPNKALSDDYRCFIIDPGPGGSGGLEKDSFLQAGMISPGNAATVHHVIVFEVSGANAAAARTKDAQEAGPGYTCFGGPGVGSGIDSFQMVLGWAPGGTTMRLSADSGVPLKKGSIFVMQVHYNLFNANAAPDSSKAYFELAPATPQYQVRLLPVANPSGLKIKANDADAVQVIAFPVSEVLRYLKQTELTIISVAPHMHTLGTQITTSIGSQALIDIPRWSFHWQQSYFLKEPFVAKGDQMIFHECHYDNSPANQPLINGVRQPPRDVTWGEGTHDEMCLSFLGIRLPMGITP